LAGACAIPAAVYSQLEQFNLMRITESEYAKAQRQAQSEAARASNAAPPADAESKGA